MVTEVFSNLGPGALVFFRIVQLVNFGDSVIFWSFVICLVLVDWWLKLVFLIN